MSQPKPVILIILDGFGWRQEMHGNAVAGAQKPNFDRYWNEYPHTLLMASGNAVGLPEGQMGNSEVGHLNIGSGRIVYQELTRISKSIDEGCFFVNEAFLKAVTHCKKMKSNLHICGLLSDGGVHSHIDHLFALIDLCAKEEMTNIYIHAFLDGRDVAPTSAVNYIKRLQEKMNALQCGKIATVQGRYYAMDRDKRWDRTEKAYRAMVSGEGEKALSALEAVENSYQNGIYDEFIIPTVIEEAGKPIATLQEDDALIFFNFRPDRAVQLSSAVTRTDFEEFRRVENHSSGVFFVSFTHYSDEINGEIAFRSQNLLATLGEVVSKQGYQQLRIAETEKYPHVTYFFNGGREEPFPGEERILVRSPKVATYDLKPEMSAYELTETLLKEIEKENHDLIVLNFANPDMVGHSGKLEPTIRAVEVVDECLGTIVDLVKTKGGVAIITADHGNADMVLDEHNNPVTCHTSFPVPCIVTKPNAKLHLEGILADLAPTVLDLMGIKQPERMTGKSLIKEI